MSSNPLIDGLRRWRPTADWRCLANIRVAAQACVRRLWGVAWVVRRLPLVTRERIRGGKPWDALYKSTSYLFYLLKEASIVHVDDDADDGEDTGYWTSGGGGDGENWEKPHHGISSKYMGRIDLIVQKHFLCVHSDDCTRDNQNRTDSLTENFRNPASIEFTSVSRAAWSFVKINEVWSDQNDGSDIGQKKHAVSEPIGGAPEPLYTGDSTPKFYSSPWI